MDNDSGGSAVDKALASSENPSIMECYCSSTSLHTVPYSGDEQRHYINRAKCCGVMRNGSIDLRYRWMGRR